MAKAIVLKSTKQRKAPNRKQHRKAPAGAPRATTTQKSAAAALAALNKPDEQLLALEDCGLAYVKAGLDPITAANVVKCITRPIREAYYEAVLALPAKHGPARPCIASAIAALDSLDMFMTEVDEPRAEIAKAKAYRRMVGEVIVSYTGTCGRWKERAEQYLGGDATTGYLVGGQCLDGDDMRQVIGLDAELLRLYHTTDDQWQALVLDTVVGINEHHHK